MPAVQFGRIAPVLATTGLLLALAPVSGAAPGRWALAGLAAVALSLVGTALIERERRAAQHRLGPADLVTYARLTLVYGVFALALTSVRSTVTTPLVALACVALALDALDGFVARRTGTSSRFGARFDPEVDALLILVLSGYLVPRAGLWVLAIGLARYALFGAALRIAWLRTPTPPRPWNKVVAALQGITLTVAAVGILPGTVSRTLLVLALCLLAESFGHQVLAAWRGSRGPGRVHDPTASEPPPWTTLAGGLLWLALVLPDRPELLRPAAFLRIPIDGAVLLALLVLLRRRPRIWVAVPAGFAIALLGLTRLLDLGFRTALDRPFDPTSDVRYAGSAFGLLRASLGGGLAIALLVGAALAALAVLVLVPLALLRVGTAAARNRPSALRLLAATGAVWAVLWAFDLRMLPGLPIASAGEAATFVDEFGRVRADLADRSVFAAELANDPLSRVPAGSLLRGLRGKDVLVVFVESYGRVAIEGDTFAAKDAAVLDAGTRQLRTAGFAARSGFLTSPTFGGISWLAHSTLQSGLWVDSQQRYDTLVSSRHSTLSGDFRRAGWRTVAVDPSNAGGWPEGTSFYHYAQIYDQSNLGYRGPTFSYAAMPDQYTLAEFQRLELDRPHRPVMAEIDLVSSHTPWTPLPRMIAPGAVGDGSVYDPMPARGATIRQVWRRPALVRESYGASVRYSIDALVGFIAASHDPNLVLVVLGDHQPATVVSGTRASHDVPVSVIAHDPRVLDRLAGWGWTTGLRPAPAAPVWPMSSFRERFLAAYDPR